MGEVLAGLPVTLVLATSEGGVGRHVRALAGGLVAAGAEVTVCGPAATEQLFRFGETGARHATVEIASGIRPVADLVAARTLAGHVGRASLVHAHGIRAGLVAGAALGRSGTPFVVTWHNAVLAAGIKAVAGLPLERRVARRPDVTLCVSADLVEHVRWLGGNDVRLAPVGAAPLPPQRRTPAEVRAELGAGDRPLVVAVGRLHRQKGFDVLVAAAARWASRDPRPLAVVAGDGPLRRSLEEDAAKAGADVRFLGRRDDTADLLRAADVVVMPSRWEGSPLAAHEALQAGRPLVASAAGGLPDLLASGAGLLVPAGDALALAAAVESLVASPAAAAALAEAALRRAGEWPFEADSVAGVLDVYAELLARA